MVVTYTLCSIADPEPALEGMARVLRTGGRLLFCEHGAAPDPNVRRWQDRVNPLWKRLGGGCHLNRAIPDIIEAGGYISVDTGSAPDANLIPVPKPVADTAFDAAACIGCGACVAACPNSAANLFTAAKISHLNLLPQGQSERWTRTENMVEVMEEYFGSCTNHAECEKACPKQISIDFIALMNADYVKAKFKNRRLVSQS